MTHLGLTLRLALADLRFERVASLCQIIGLAALLVPLLILLGIKNGVLTDRTTALLQNPESLRLTIARTAAYPRALIDSLSGDPDVRFVAPHPVVLAVVSDFAGTAPGAPVVPRVSLLATGLGDPYLPADSAAPGPGEVWLSASLAGGLGASPGDRVTALMPPKSGEPDGGALDFTVAGVIPAGTWGRVGALLNEADLFLIQDWTDGHVQGADLDPLRGNTTPRETFPSIRLYAASVPAAFRLVDRLAAEGVPVGASLEEARALADLDHALTSSFRVVAGVGLVGYAAAFAASLWNNIGRKRRAISLLRLGGLGRAPAALLPVLQAAGIATLGWGTALLTYAAGAHLLNATLGPSLDLDGPVTRLGPSDIAASATAAMAVALAASVWAAIAVTRITPQQGIDDG
ncbi:FtsX-like permease family protein [Amaricoccus macauensis]|nr:FtsX-like permease family protein [Amaricoccus macauensis]